MLLLTKARKEQASLEIQLKALTNRTNHKSPGFTQLVGVF